MKLKDIMTTPVKTLEPKDTLVNAHNLMRSTGVRHVLVVAGEILVGVLSERDVALHQQHTGESIFASPTDTVDMAMQQNVQTAAPEDDVSEAARHMSSLKIGCLPVLEQDKIVGIVTTTDVLGSYPSAHHGN